MADSQVITQHWLPARRERPTTTRIHKNTYFESAEHPDHTSPPAHTHTISFSPFSLLTHTHTYTGPAKHKDYIMSRSITMTPTWPGCAAALPLAWVCLNLLFEVKDCPQFKQVCTYADAKLKHVVCISCCRGGTVSFGRSQTQRGVGNLFLKNPTKHEWRRFTVPPYADLISDSAAFQHRNNMCI